MTSFDPLIANALEAQVPLRPERRPDWDDVLGRSRRPLRRRRTLPLVAAAAALAIAASALAATGHDPFGSLGSWLNGSPGTPASPAEQASFAARNAASYAKFPAGTKLRRLDRGSIAGKSFVLLGFKSGQSLCLQLEPANAQTGARTTDQCVTLRELDSSNAPALVAAETFLEVGKHTTLADSIVGFADDTVKAIQYRSAHGAWQTAPVENNVFLGLAHKKLKGPRLVVMEPLSEIEQVRAVTTSGKTVAIPFVAGYVTYPSGPPKVPSYVSSQTPKPQQLPGPARPTVRFAGGTISWFVDHQKRGTAWQPAASQVLNRSSILYSRAVQPDPDNPFRIGVFLRKTAGMLSPRQQQKDTVMLCETSLVPLGPGGGWGCHPAQNTQLLFGTGEPFVLRGFPGGQQVTNIAGLAADQVASMKLFLGNGRVVPVALRDNAFSAGAPTTQFPAKLVAYDAQGRVLGLQVIAGPAHPVPCPTPAIWPASKLPATKPYQRIDLANLTVDGKQILGMTPAEVTAALGKPNRAAGFKHLGFGQPAYFYGGTLPSGTLLLVQFWRTKQGTKVVGLDFQGRGLSDTTLGHILNTTPLALQQELTGSDRFRLASAYGSTLVALGVPIGGGCSGIVSTTSRAQIDFGVNPYENARPYLNITSPSARPVIR